MELEKKEFIEIETIKDEDVDYKEIVFEHNGYKIYVTIGNNYEKNDFEITIFRTNNDIEEDGIEISGKKKGNNLLIGLEKWGNGSGRPLNINQWKALRILRSAIKNL